MQDLLDWCEDIFDDGPLRLLMRVVLVLFGLAAIVHVLSMLSLTGYRWSDAGLFPRICDIAFSALFLIAVAAIVMRNAWAVPIWIVIALAQIGLFAALPEKFAGATSEMMAPQTMIYTHAALFVAFVSLLIARRFR